MPCVSIEITIEDFVQSYPSIVFWANTSVWASYTDSLLGFIPHLEQLFNEDMLIGTGWSAKETLRPLAYGTLTDFAHHVRGQLSLAQVGHICIVIEQV